MLQSLSRTQSKHYFFCHLENGKCNFLRAKKILKESQSLWCVTMYGNIVSVYTLVRIPNGPYISVHSGICVPPLGIRVDLNEGCILGVFRYFPEFSEIFGFFLPKNWTRFFLFLVFSDQPCGATTVVVAVFFYGGRTYRWAQYHVPASLSWLSRIFWTAHIIGVGRELRVSFLRVRVD